MKQSYALIVFVITALAMVFYTGCEPQKKAAVEATTEKAVKVEEPKAAEVKPAAAVPAKEVKVEAKPAEKAPVAEAAKEVKVETKPAAAAPAAEAAKEVKAEAKPADTNPVAVTVNGFDILEVDVKAKIKPQLDKAAARLPADKLGAYETRIRQQVLDNMIIEHLLDELVKAKNITVTDEDVTKHLEETGAQQNPPLSIDDIKALLEARGQSFEETKAQIKKGLSFERLMEMEFGSQINFTVEDANKYYTENPKEFQTPEQIGASHILVKFDTTDPNFDKAKAKTKAEALLARIKAGEDFATLAKENSDCPSAAKGGDLGLFGKGSMVPEFEKAAFALEVGQVSDVVETQFGYHIIKKTDYKPASTLAFNDVKANILENLANRKRGELSRKYVDDLKKNAKIVYPAGKEPAPQPMPIKLTPTPAAGTPKPAETAKPAEK